MVPLIIPQIPETTSEVPKTYRLEALRDLNYAESDNPANACTSRKAKEERDTAPSVADASETPKEQSDVKSDVTDAQAIADRLASADPATLTAITKLLQRRESQG